jgi:hypothetical protein
MSRLRDVALLLLVLALMTGLASAGPGLKVTSVKPDGSQAQFDYDSASSPSVRAPQVGKYWDGLASTDYYNIPPSIAAPPNPQIAVGPTDVITIVNRTIARYANPNQFGGSLVTNPYSNPPTDRSWLDVWLGISMLQTLCPSYAAAGGANNSTCVIDNPSIRYDQMQGRFVVLFTITDVPSHRSNFILIVSKTAQFTRCTTGIPTCPAFSPLFDPSLIAPVVGGTATGGVNTANWFLQAIPINLPTNGATALSGSLVVSTSLASSGFANFCTNGGGGVPGGAVGACTNYFPTGARMGLDNDNIILTAPVLDQTQPGGGAIQGQLPTLAGQIMGPYAGTRVVSVPKLAVYNAVSALTTSVNLADSTGTGTLTGCTTTSINGGTPNLTTIAAGICASANPVPGGTLAAQNIPPIFWEPDNLRGRVDASFDSQVIPKPSPTAGVIVPIHYLVGTLITDHLVNPFTVHTTGSTLAYFVQPVVYSCPLGSPLLASDPIFVCGTAGVAAPGLQSAESAVLGPLLFNTSSLAHVGDPAPVGQSNANDGTSMALRRLFVGDSRPQQVMFREGLLYIARTVRLYDASNNALGTSTVLYDALLAKQPLTTTTLSANATATATTITVASSAGLVANQSIIQIDNEKMSVTAIVGTTLTVVRGFGNSTAAAHVAGTLIFESTVSTFTATGATLPLPVLALETEWFNGTNVPDPTGNVLGWGFYGPMFDSPANVVSTSNLTLPGSSPISPINLFPWLEKLFVGMTTGGTTNLNNTFFNNHPSLWDFRPGDDAYDTTLPYMDPANGQVFTTEACTQVPPTTCPMIPFGTRGGASTDPNDGSLWLYGEFAKNRLSTIPGPGQWGTSVANYALDFPATDPYGNDNLFFADVQPGAQSFTWITMAKNLGITPLNLQVVPPASCPQGILQPPSGGSSATPGSSTVYCQNFAPGTVVTRSEMAHWVISSLMDDLQLNAFLAATGGDPRVAGISMFADTAGDTNIREIEAMARLGITIGCSVNDVQRNYCPNDPVTRGQMAVFLIRAKMRNVFPASLSGAPGTGDNFGLFSASTPYFTDVPTTHPYFLFIQKMKELGITVGTGTGSTYGPNDPLTRAQIATFMVRAFFL